MTAIASDRPPSPHSAIKRVAFLAAGQWASPEVCLLSLSALGGSSGPPLPTVTVPRHCVTARHSRHTGSVCVTGPPPAPPQPPARAGAALHRRLAAASFGNKQPPICRRSWHKATSRGALTPQ